jgi:hypothetical protein
MACPDSSCQHSFIAYYDQIDRNLYEFTGIVTNGSFEKRRFSEIINSISPSFEKLYNEALKRFDVLVKRKDYLKNKSSINISFNGQTKLFD